MRITFGHGKKRVSGSLLWAPDADAAEVRGLAEALDSAVGAITAEGGLSTFFEILPEAPDIAAYGGLEGVVGVYVVEEDDAAVRE